MTTDDPVGGISVSLPFSVEDFAKALLQVLRGVQDMGKIIGKAVDFVDRRKARGAAENLSTLAFRNGGMQETLRRIASGTWSNQDIVLLERQLLETAKEVDDSLIKLARYRGRLRENFGMGEVKKLDSITEGFGSKRWIRDNIQALIADAVSPYPDRDRIQQTAKDLDKGIDELNQSLIDLHNMVLPPKKLKRARVGKQSLRKKRERSKPTQRRS